MANALCLLNDLCRLCLDEPGSHNILRNDRLIQDILLCTGILHISCQDNLPQKICTTCMYKVAAAKDLQRYSTQNDLYMKSLLHNNSVIEHEIARPKIHLRPLEEIVSSSTITEDLAPGNNKNKQCNQNNYESQNTRKPTITVRSLADINASISLLDSPKRDETSHKEKTSSCDSPEDKKTKKKKKRKIECDDSPERDETPHEKKTSSCDSPQDNKTKKKKKRKIKCDSSSETRKKERQKESKTIISTEDNKDNVENKCDICKKTYATPKKLYMHRRTHSKSLHCPLDGCGKSFTTKGDLQKHTRTHTGEKPYKCDLCDKSFTQNVSLRAHKEAVHIEKM